ncbi:Tn3 family transposase [Nonomuraea aurantiaca]|uniref:Tn3 family transposase n=1 Tax=Nonomuraea aurantiaca TaxID=2878562 RepID=UPI0035564712
MLRAAEHLRPGKIDLRKIRKHWGAILRVVASIYTGEVRAYDVVTMLQRDGHPTALGEAIAAYGRHLQVLAVRHEALFCSDGGERPPALCRRSGEAKVGGSLIRGSPGRVGAASTKSGRSRTAGWAGPGEREGKVYARNRCRYASSI